MGKRKLKVAHFSFSDNYGASGAAYELHRGLLQKGIISDFYVREKTRNDDNIIELEFSDSLQERFFRTINKLYFNENRVNQGTAPVSFDCVGISLNKQLESRLQEYDVFHIHWMSEFLSAENIYQLSFMGKPIVWTMHDFHPFTGGCHCPEACRKYETDCSECPELRVNYSNITKYILLEKQSKYTENICIVTASSWLKNIVKCSRVFRNNQCEVIPIGIDTDCFVPKNKADMKQKAGFSVDTKVILIGAQSLKQNVKGYAGFKCVMQLIAADVYCKELLSTGRLVLLTFGHNSEIEEYGNEVPVFNMGFVSDRKKLCEIYNAADVFVFPSIQDTFGMTAVEAMACGTPTVAFNINAMRDVIISGMNGYKAEINDYSSMASYIVQVLKDSPINAESCRKRIVDNYSIKCETKNMYSLYYRLIEQKERSVMKKKQTVNNKKLEEFIYKCSFEILTGVAPNQNLNTEIRGILAEYNPIFVTPERKVKRLFQKQSIDSKIPIYIYGAGEFGKRTLKELQKCNAQIEGFWDISEDKIGHTLENFVIQKPVNKVNIDGKKVIIAGSDFIEMIRVLIDLGYVYGQDFY